MRQQNFFVSVPAGDRARLRYPAASNRCMLVSVYNAAAAMQEKRGLACRWDVLKTSDARSLMV